MLTQISAVLTSDTSLEKTARPTCAAAFCTPFTDCSSFISAFVERFIASSDAPGADSHSTTTSVSLKFGSHECSDVVHITTPTTMPTAASARAASGVRMAASIRLPQAP